MLLNKRLYFAGEATSEDWYGYMQGAYWTGDEKGNMIAENISLRVQVLTAQGRKY